MALGCAGAALVAAGCGLTASKTKTVTATHTVTVTHTVTTTVASSPSNPCAASDLTATFEELQGSAGAGNIVYTLKVVNASQAACTVSGVPTIDFLDSSGHALKETISPNGAGTAVLVTLQPGDSARSQVRFSPDVDPCDPGTATTLRVTMADSSTLDAKIAPATKLCGNGSVQPTPFSGAA
jgi:Protein of unknown function (DUF4232)